MWWICFTVRDRPFPELELVTFVSPTCSEQCVHRQRPRVSPIHINGVMKIMESIQLEYRTVLKKLHAIATRMGEAEAEMRSNHCRPCRDS